jgi:two-component system, NarL family, response regulator LiaR
MAIRLLVIDDHPTTRLSLRIIFQEAEGIEVVGEAGSGSKPLAKAAELKPDVVLLDSCLPDMPGGKVAEKITQLGVCTTVLVFSGYDDEAHVMGMVDSGAAGYVLKTEEPEQVLEAVRNVARGEPWFSARILGRVLAQARTDLSRLDVLSKREMEVLQLIGRGCSDADIADRLAISEKTVTNHITNIYDKLGVHSRADAAIWAWRHKLVNNSSGV